jgi:cytochrome c oxidase subunit 3
MAAHGAVDDHHGDDDHHHEHRTRPEDWPGESMVGNATSGKVGMWIFLLSDALMFAGFLLAYGIIRGGSAIWACTEELVEAGKCLPPVCSEFAQSLGAVCAENGRFLEEPTLGINFTAGLTFLLICSSVTMVLALSYCKEGDRKNTVKYLAMTTVGGMLFLCGQYYEYFGIFGFHGLIAHGLTFGHSAYATTFFMITAFHGMHVFSGVVYLAISTYRATQGRFDDGYTSEVEILGLFWHFVDLIWILVFTLIYLVPNEHGV